MASTPCRCAVRGSINNDEYFYVRNIARPGETISSHRYQRRVGGKGANQAIAILKAGGAVDFYGSVGEDGLWVKETVAALGLDPNTIEVSDVPTGRALIQVADSGENSIILFPGANHSQLTETKWATSENVFSKFTHLLLQNEIHWDSTLYALNNAKAQGVTTIFNPSPMPYRDQIDEFPWGKIDWLIVNEGEALALLAAFSGHLPAHEASDQRSPEETLRLLSDYSGFVTTNIICTLGADGLIACIPAFHRQTGTLLRVPAATLQGTVRDTTGAGDCFTGYFAQGMMEFGAGAKPGSGIGEQDIERILKVCVHAAGMCVERPGTIDSIPTMDEVNARMSGTN